MPKYCGEDVFCIITGQPNGEKHHVKSRGSGGKDEDWNLMPLLHKFHQECHSIGLRRFADKYSKVRSWLIEKGWELCPVTFRWKRSSKITA